MDVQRGRQREEGWGKKWCTRGYPKRGASSRLRAPSGTARLGGCSGAPAPKGIRWVLAGQAFREQRNKHKKNKDSDMGTKRQRGRARKGRSADPSGTEQGGVGGWQALCRASPGREVVMDGAPINF